MKSIFIMSACTLFLVNGHAFAARSEMGDNTQVMEMGTGAEITATGLEANVGGNVGYKGISVGIAAAQAGGVHINENINSGKMGDNTQVMKMGQGTKIKGASVSVNKNVNSAQ